MADTLSTNVAETTQELIAATLALLPQEAPMLSLVTRMSIPKGRDRIEVPRVNSTSAVQLPTEGDELVTSSQFDLTSTTLQPTHRAIMIRIHERATYFSRDDVVAMVSKELAQTQAQDIDTDLTAEFANFHTDNDVGATNTDLDFDIIQEARLKLVKVTRANGGPAPQPLYTVLAPIPEYDVFLDLGSLGLLGNNYVVPGISAEIMANYHIPQNKLSGVQMFRDGYMTENGSNDFICAMFAKSSLHFAVSKDWDIKTFEVPNWIGTVIRSVADYNSGILGYTHHGAQITADGA